MSANSPCGASTGSNNGAAKKDPKKSAAKAFVFYNSAAGLTTQPIQYDLFKK